MNIKNTSNHFTGITLVIIGSILFSTKAVMVKMAFRDTPVNAVSLLALRMVFAFPFFAVMGIFSLRKYKESLPTKRQWINIILVGLLGYYLSSLLDFIGLRYITAGLERLILFLYPSFVLVMNALFFKDKISNKQKIALLMCYVGLLIAFVGEARLDIAMRNLIIGSSLIFLCAITYAIYIVGMGRLVKKIPAMLYNSFALIASCIGVFIHYFFQGDFGLKSMNEEMVIYGLLLGIFATVLPTYIISNGIQKIGSSDAAIVSAIGPLSTVILAYFFLGEKIDLFQLIGTIIVISGILLISKKEL